MTFDSLVGLTVLAVRQDEEYGYDPQPSWIELDLSDGSSVRINGTGWEYEGLQISPAAPHTTS